MYQENQFIPYRSAELPVGPWLVFAPHPDDETFGMGGTLLLGTKQGFEVTLVILTDGALGGSEDDLAVTRETEAREAARRLQIRDVQFWRQCDRELRITDVLLRRIVELVQATKPASVFFPSPFELHPDHRVTAALVWEGLKRCREFSGTGYAYEISVQHPCVNRLIDISAVADEKRAVMGVYASQMLENDYADLVEALDKARTYTLPSEVTHAEAFYAYDSLSGRLEEKIIGSLSPYWRKGGADVPIPPLVSVIVRTKDRPVFLRKALQSIVKQIYPNLEMVVINDGGPSVAEIVQGFEGIVTRIRYIHLEENRGRTAAANLGLERVTGKYVIFLDDDDWFLPEHIATLVEVLENDDSIGVAYTGVECVQADDTGTRKRIHVFNQSYDPIRLLLRNYIPMHAALFRRSLIEAGCRLDETLKLYEDWDFWVQLSQKTLFKHVDGITAVYRIGGLGGFGVTGDESLVHQAQRIFFQKWRHLWPIEKLVDIIEYARHEQDYQSLRTEQESREAHLREMTAEFERVKHQLGSTLSMTQQRVEELVQVLEQTRSSLCDVQIEREILHQGREQLAASLANQSAELEQVKRQAELWANRCLELESSHSWRITKPLRVLTLGIKQGNQAINLGMNIARRYLALSYEVLRAEGPGRLLQRTLLKLRPPVNQQVDPVATFQLETSWEALNFPVVAQPQVTIIIPVHNQHLYTYTCLKSIIAIASEVTYEIIVVDDHSSDETRDMLTVMKGILVLDNPGRQGFVHACNLGACRAKGEILVFLNNDTVVTPDWLKGIVETFASQPQAGLVGVRLIYPDGRLQEAGGIIWRDASAWNYGRSDHPNKPQYNYLREVDYCSGACLAIPRELFQNVGAFSQEFAPAYYEDADLAFKVKAVGKQVFYQPGVTVVHFEGMSCGRGITSNIKRYQILHQRKFEHKWKLALSSHRVNGILPELEKDRGRDRRILVIDAKIPTPDRDSGSLRMGRLLALLRDLGFKVSFVAVTLEQGGSYGLQLQRQGIEVLYAPFVSSIEEYLSFWGKYVDVILLSRVTVAEKFLSLAREQAPFAKLIFDTVDLRFLREKRFAQLQGKQLLAKAATWRESQELALARAADVTFVVSPVEKKLLSELSSNLKIEVLSNIHDPRGVVLGFEQREGILFLGSFNHPPNADAVAYFVHDILPLVEQRLGSVKVFIVGSDPPPKIKALAKNAIIVTGFVSDVSDYLDRCRLSIAPLRYGAGVKGKINMSMAYGLPVVASPIAAEGMYLTDGENVILGEDAESFAQGVVKLYQDEQLWSLLSKNGLVNIKTHFSTEKARDTLCKVLRIESSVV